MTEVTLRPMTTAEFDDWVPGAIEEYANDHIRAGSMPADSALDMARKQFAELLPDGVDTREHHLLMADVDGDTVGMLWLHIREGAETSAAFVYDVIVEEPQRGVGPLHHDSSAPSRLRHQARTQTNATLWPLRRGSWQIGRAPRTRRGRTRGEPQHCAR